MRSDLKKGEPIVTVQRLGSGSGKTYYYYGKSWDWINRLWKRIVNESVKKKGTFFLEVGLAGSGGSKQIAIASKGEGIISFRDDDFIQKGGKTLKAMYAKPLIMKSSIDENYIRNRSVNGMGSRGDFYDDFNQNDFL